MTTETNEARFTIDGSASEDPVTGDRGYVATNGQTLTVTLETNPAPALSVTFEVYDPNDGSSPLSSKDAPNLTWTDSGTAKQVLASPSGSATITVPATGAHSYIIRCTVSLDNGETSFERLVAIPKTSVSPHLRKTVPGESTQFTNRTWSDDQNDFVDAIDSVVAGALSIDGGYNTFGSNPSIVHVDGAEGQGDELKFDIVGDRHVVIDCDNANAASGGNGWSIPYGFKVFYDTKDFYIGRGDNNDLAMRGHLGDIQLSASEAIEINTDKSLSLRGKAVTLTNWGPTTDFVVEYDKLGDGDTSFKVNQDSITKLAVDSDGNTVFIGIAKHPDGSVSAPSIAWTDYPTNGLYRPATWGDAVGVAVNGQTGLIVNYNTLASAPATNVYNASGQSYLFQITGDAHGSAADIGTHSFVGLNSSPASFTYAGIVAHCVDNTASSEDGRLDFYAAVGGVLDKRMSISDKVGIGTTSLSSRLTLGAGTDSTIGISLKDGVISGENDIAGISANTATGEIKIGSLKNNYYPAFYSHGLEAARFDLSGNYGVGISSSMIGRLHTRSTANSGIAGYFEATATGAYSNIGVAAYSSGNLGAAGYFEASATGAVSNTGIYAEAKGDTGKGVHGKVSSSAGWAGYFEGRGYFSENVGISGNVGIGTTNPISRLHVEGAAGSAIGVIENTVTNDAAFTWAMSQMASNLSTGNSLVHFIGKEKSVKNSGYFGFHYQSSGSDSNCISLGLYGVNSVLNVTGAGTVGVGTTTPNAKFHSRTTDNSGIAGYFEATATGAISNTGIYATAAGDSGKAVHGVAGGATAYAGYFEGRGYFSGDVGIGTTSPSFKLHVAGDTGIGVRSTGVDGVFTDLLSSVYSGNNNEQNAIQATVSSAADNSGFNFMVSDGGGASTKKQAYRMSRATHRFYVGGVEAVRIDNGGDVGIGIFSTLLGRVHSKTTDNSGIAGYFEATATGAVSNTGVYANAAGANGKAVHGVSPWTTSWAGYFEGRVYLSGDVGLGTTTPACKLAIYAGDNKDSGPIVNLGGNSTNQTESGRIRFTETSMGQSPFYQGAFVHYNGSTNTLNIGVHETADALQASDTNVIVLPRGSNNVGIGVAPLANMASGDLVLEGGSLVLKEITTPTADTNYGKVYTKSDNKLYFQDGAGTEHEIAFA